MRVIRVLLIVGILLVGIAAAEANFADFSEDAETVDVSGSGHRTGHKPPFPNNGGGNGGGGAPG